MDPVKALRYFLFLILAMGVVGTGAELLLLGHYDGYYQTIPLGVLGAGIAVMAWCAVDRRPRSLRALQVVMALHVIAGAIGVLLHYNGNAAFERELSPGIGGLDLVVESLTGATPALAPGSMAQLGLLGLLYTFRHPVLTGSNRNNHQPSE